MKPWSSSSLWLPPWLCSSLWRRWLRRAVLAGQSDGGLGRVGPPDPAVRPADGSVCRCPLQARPGHAPGAVKASPGVHRMERRGPYHAIRFYSTASMESTILSFAIFRRGTTVASRQAAMDNTTASAIGISGGKTSDSSSVAAASTSMAHP